MDDRSRNLLHVGQSTRDWNAKHPSELEAAAETAAELDATVTRLETANVQFETGTREEAAATKEKDRQAGEIHEDFLIPISAIARGNSALDPAIARRFRVPKAKGDMVAYIGSAHAIMGLAEEHKAVFIKDGMQATFVEDLGKALDAFARAVTTATHGRQLHVQARAELEVEGKHLMALLKRMDGINRTRFRKEPHLLESWKAARNVAWPAPKPEDGKADTSAA